MNDHSKPTPKMKALLPLLALPLCAVLAAPGVRAADAPAAPEPPAASDSPATSVDLSTTGTPTHLKFSDPSKPGTVKLRVVWGDVTVTGADSPDVTVVANIKNKTEHEERPDGLRRLDSEISYTASEKDNVITIAIGGDPHAAAAGARLDLTVPRNTSVSVKSSLGGNATVKNISGDIEIHSLNGEVRLEQINGSALVETMNGGINASFTKVAEGRPLSFTSMNGEINVRIPADTKANVRLRTQNGAVYTDFDEKALVTHTEASRGHTAGVMIHHGDVYTSDDGADWHRQVRDAVREATRAGVEAAREAAKAAREAAQAAREGIADARGDDPEIPDIPIPPMPPALPTLSGGKIVTGTLNGGGPDIQIATMNGTITLRKLQP